MTEILVQNQATVTVTSIVTLLVTALVAALVRKATPGAVWLEVLRVVFSAGYAASKEEKK